MEAKQPLVSIIIPTYNEEEYLPKLLASLAKQTFRDFEIIVADAKSTDRTRKLAKAAGARVVVGGVPAVGRNNGAAAARGAIFIFFDADIELPDAGFLAATVQEFNERALDISTCRLTPMDKRATDTFFFNVYNIYTTALKKILPRMPGFCVYVRRSVHEAIEGFNEDIKLGEDHDYAQRGGKISAFGFLQSRYIPVSPRRFDRDGWASIAVRYLLAELHMLTVGPITSDIFKYRFGHRKPKSKK